MNIDEVLQEGRRIWGDEKTTLTEAIVCMGKVFGDICRYQRAAPKDAAKHTDAELKKELGNMIVSVVRWCDDFGYDPKECIAVAFESQKKFAKENRSHGN